MMSLAAGLLGSIAVVSACLYVSAATIYAGWVWMCPNAFAAATAVAGGVARNIWNFYLTNPAGTNQPVLMAVVPFLIGTVTNGLSWISSAVGSAIQHGTWFIFKRNQTNKVYN